jgi:hypothetical protein
MKPIIVTRTDDDSIRLTAGGGLPADGGEPEPTKIEAMTEAAERTHATEFREHLVETGLGPPPAGPR